MNGKDYSSNSVHVFHIGKLRIKLRKGWSTKARESYSTTMKVKPDLCMCVPKYSLRYQFRSRLGLDFVYQESIN
jgi:hypothetical protein